MDTLVRVQVVCNLSELRSLEVFHRAAEFARYDADIDIVCTDTRQMRAYQCSAVRHNCYGWRYFKEEWERQFGRVNP